MRVPLALQSTRAPCQLHRFVEQPIEHRVDAPASRDDRLGPRDVIGQIVALMLVRLRHDACTNIADLVGDLDQFCSRRFPRCVDNLFLAALLLRQRHVVSHLDHERCDALAEFLRQLRMLVYEAHDREMDKIVALSKRRGFISALPVHSVV